jgi:hypothetical protein
MSLAGFTAPLVAASTPLTSIVFVNAMIPLPGEKAGDWWDSTGAIDARIGAAKEYGYSTEFDLDTYFLDDVPPEILAASGPPSAEADIVFGSVCDFETWPAIPLKVVAGKDDRFFPVGFQRRLARERLGIAADVLPGGHPDRAVTARNPEPLPDLRRIAVPRFTLRRHASDRLVTLYDEHGTQTPLPMIFDS